MKNMVVLLADCLRYDYINKQITPNIMRIAEEGTFYTKAMAGDTSTLFSMPYILSSTQVYNPRRSIPTILERNGYNTFLVTTNLYVYIRFKEGWGEAMHVPVITKRESLTALIHRARGFLGDRVNRYTPSLLREKVEFLWNLIFQHNLSYLPAGELLDIVSAKLNHNPFFVWAHLMDPHGPYCPSKGYSKSYLNEYYQLYMDIINRGKRPNEEETEVLKILYRENVTEMDHAIGIFYDSLPEDIVVVVTSDHGEAFGECGRFGHPFHFFIPCLQHVPLIVAKHGVKGVHDEEFSMMNFPKLVYDILDIEEEGE